MKLFNYFLSFLLCWGLSVHVQAQCSASFSYTNTGNTYNFTASTSPGLFNPVFIWTIDDYANNSSHTVYGATPSFTFSGTPALGYHYACLTVLDSITGCQTSYCDSIMVNGGGNPCNGFSVTQNHTVSGTTANFTSTVTGGTSGYSYTWDFNGLGASSQANPSFTYPGAGWYAADLTVYDSLTGCYAYAHDSVYIAGSTPCSNASASYQYNVTPNGAVNFSSSSTGFFPPFATYTWVFGNGTISHGANTSAQLSNGWHYVCLTVSDSFCTDTYCDTVYVNVNSNPCSGASASYQYNVTPNGVTQFTSSVTGFQSGAFYTWDFGNGNISYGANPSAQLSNGWHYVCLTVDDSICTYTHCDSVYVNMNSNPCSGASASYQYIVDSSGVVYFNFNGAGFQPWASYTWNFGNGTVGYGANATAQLPNGWHYVCLTVDDSICTDTYCDSIYVNSNSNPCSGATASYQYTVTPNGVTQFTSSATGFLPWASYTWDFGNGTVGYGANATTQLSNGWHYVCLTVDDSICTYTHCDSVYVNMNSNPCSGASASYQYTVDSNGVTQFTSSTTGFQPWASYTWNFGNGTVGYGANATAQLPNGWHYVCLTVDDSICTDTYCDTIYVNSNNNPCLGASASYQYTVTPNGVTQFTSSATGFLPWASYTWNFGNGTVGYGANATAQLSNGWHYVCLTVDDSICADTYCDTIYVNMNSNPCSGVSASYQYTVDSNGVTQFTSSTTGFQPWALYTWDFGNGNVSYAANPSAQLSNGWHYVCLTLDDSICTYTYCDSVYVSNNAGCTQNEVTLTINLDNYAGETSWEVTDANGTVVATNSYTHFMSGQTMTQAICLPTGCYNLTIYDSYGDGICCAYGQGHYSLVDNATGATLASGGAFTYSETTNFCVGGATNPCGNFVNSYFTYTANTGGSVSFTPQIVGNQYPMNFYWDFGNGTTSTASHPTATYNANGYYLVCLTADSAGCTFTYCDTIMVTGINTTPVGPCANLDLDVNIHQDSTNPFLLWMQPVVTGAAQNAQFSFVWDFGDNTGAFSGSPTHQYNSYGSYIVCVMALDTVNGCVETFCDTISIDSTGNFSRTVTKPGFFVNTLPPVIDFYNAVEQVEQNDWAISLFPNPARETINVAVNSAEAINGVVSILDITGKVAYNQTLDLGAGAQQITLPVSQLPSGVYLVKVTSETAQKTMKFIKE